MDLLKFMDFLIENSNAFTKTLQRKMNHIAFEMKQRKNYH